MSRRMYSESQLNKMIDSKLEGYDASIPTDLLASGNELKLQHDSTPLGEGVLFKTLFGNKSLLGTGNIDLYTHYITLETSQSALQQYSGTLILRVVSSSNIPVDSLTDLNTLLHNTEKTIDCSGFFTITERGKTYNIFKLDWKGSFENSTFGYIGEGLAEDESTSLFTTATDVVETI